MLTFAFDHLGRKHQHALPLVLGEQAVDHLSDRLGFKHLIRVKGAVRCARSCKQQAQVVVNLGHGADGRSRVVA